MPFVLVAAGDNFAGQCAVSAAHEPYAQSRSDTKVPSHNASEAQHCSEAEIATALLDGTRARTVAQFHLAMSGGTEIAKIACGDRHTLLVTASGVCMSVGSNRTGQLGITAPPSSSSTSTNASGSAATDTNSNVANPSSSETATIHIPRPIPNLSAVKVTQVAAGAHHSVALSDNGRVYTWGSNKQGACGIGKPGSIQRAPQRVKDKLENELIAEIACGFAHTCVRTNGGDLYCFGFNRHGQCGADPSNLPIVPQPRLVSQLRRRVASIACGRHHSLAILNDGNVYSWGGAEGGRLGSEAVHERHQQTQRELAANPLKELATENYVPLSSCLPAVIKSLAPNSELIGGKGARVVRAAGGWYHSLFLTNAGMVLGTGDTSAGQLGIRPLREEHYYPTPVRLFQVAAATLGHPSQLWFAFNKLPVELAEQQQKAQQALEASAAVAAQSADSSEVQAAVFDLPEPVASIHAGAYHSALVTTSGKVLLAGIGAATGAASHVDVAADDGDLVLPIDNPTAVPTPVVEYRTHSHAPNSNRTHNNCSCDVIQLPAEARATAIGCGAGHTVIGMVV
ncbi:hypothetical protein CAOG_03633 [Capsaspora owczarzaki ATCC 30864]|uniref:RCC1-like domain-containing protein n=1 Tax=Capsaspora owczarzaki (strain ATCC 30864) TaxID=595528 RepID=A0A0D2WPR3_CAPO3|nr:hypothetical protein CAOG_03633 [Capsaspora owczarzaki ATCC 30864]KJE92718.1 hypothetical protein CAOG_003633 [Capsaspora owczarzaki ATCC 30864]|eukprot:XP_004363361.1 hypothetical protein CAOG_03633 [Capsaspora owczarzaki ATCC 30864]